MKLERTLSWAFAGLANLASLAVKLYLVGIRHEERDLLRRFGDDDARYRERVPMLFPR